MSQAPHSNIALNIDPELTDRIVDGRYGLMLSSDRDKRLLRIAEIFSLYTRRELLRENGFDSAIIAKVHRWLARHGLRFRDKTQSFDAVICTLDIGSFRRSSRRNAIKATRQHVALHSRPNSFGS